MIENYEQWKQNIAEVCTLEDKILSDKFVTSRGGTKCVECLTIIREGERNRVLNAVFDGELRSYMFCAACSHAFSWVPSVDYESFDKALAERNSVREKNEKSA